jgi:hypothetical protein
MQESDLSDKFMSFEKSNRLFELKDNNDTYIWDIIRFDIYVNLMWDFKATPLVKKDYKASLNLALLKLKSLFNYWVDNKKYENFFYLCSRNTLKGKLFDQNIHSVVNHFPLNSSFLFESNSSARQEFFFTKSFYDFPQLLHRKFFKSKSVFDYSKIVDMVTKEFGSSTLNEAQLGSFVNAFYSDLDFFTKLFKTKETKQIFITQNGIQKGFFAAAKKLKIPTYEFQHGIVDKAHLAYNYPDLNLDISQAYLPDAIFSLSDYWFKALYLPNVSIYPLGNDFFSKTIPDITSGNNAMTIVSADVFGLTLERFLLSNVDRPEILQRKIFFKLHPNQFREKEHYKLKFSQWENIEVVSNEFSISELIEQSDTLLTIQSTAVYEALQAGRKVILLKESTYKRHAELFNNPNLYLVGNENELNSALASSISATGKVTFFAPFDTRVLEKAIGG